MLVYKQQVITGVVCASGLGVRLKHRRPSNNTVGLNFTAAVSGTDNIGLARKPKG